ncbi:MAG: MFS transporter [Anaerolineae bacterium]|nr:MFS transporter [Anaerolineae bacterium]
MRRVNRGIHDYYLQIRKFNRNIRLLLISSILGGLAQGIFSVDFNLYILSLGIEPDSLGRILSAGPFAHALASIPIGFIGELLGHRVAFTAIYGIAGIAHLVQVATPNTTVIAVAAFVSGLALSGNFVVRLPFLAANVSGSERTHVFSLDTLIFGLTMALGSLLGGFLPNAMRWLTDDLTLQYRYTLYVCGALLLLAVVPILFITPPPTHPRKGKISLHPYLWGIDGFTVRSAAVELFIGVTLGLVYPFMNLYFIYHLGVGREYYGTVAALLFIPTTIAALLGPALASRFGTARTVVASRYMIPITTLLMALTTVPWLGAGGFWAYRGLFSMSQSLWFAFVMKKAAERAKSAVSAWLEITFWLGQALAALVTGSLLADSNYVLPFYLSTAAALITGILTQVFIGSRSRWGGEDEQETPTEIEHTETL